MNLFTLKVNHEDILLMRQKAKIILKDAKGYPEEYHVPDWLIFKEMVRFYIEE